MDRNTCIVVSYRIFYNVETEDLSVNLFRILTNTHQPLEMWFTNKMSQKPSQIDALLPFFSPAAVHSVAHVLTGPSSVFF